MDFRVVLVITPIVFSWIFTVFWLGRWDVFRLTPLGLPKKGVAPFKNYQVWEDSALIPAKPKSKNLKVSILNI